MTTDSLFEPRRDRPAIIARLLAVRRTGQRSARPRPPLAFTWRPSAAGSPATQTWQLRLLLPNDWPETGASRPGPLDPHGSTPLDVPVHPLCPDCDGPVELCHSESGKLFYWSCPYCDWAMWRPRHPLDCSRCGGPRFWLHDRRSVHCPDCGLRMPA